MQTKTPCFGTFHAGEDYITWYYSEAYCSKSSSSSSRSSTLPKIKLDLQFLINNFCFNKFSQIKDIQSLVHCLIMCFCFNVSLNHWTPKVCQLWLQWIWSKPLRKTYFWIRGWERECFINANNALRKKCLYLMLFWSILSLIWTKCGKILRISPYSVRMRENTDQNYSKYGHFLRSDVNKSRLINDPLVKFILSFIIREREIFHYCYYHYCWSFSFKENTFFTKIFSSDAKNFF